MTSITDSSPKPQYSTTPILQNTNAKEKDQHLQ